MLYLLMGIAGWLVWRAAGFRQARLALTLFLVQLAANVLWTWIFFAWQQGALAFYESLLLTVLIAATAATFWRIRALAALLLLPYLAWVCFATVLTYNVWQRNPHLLG
jgi:translocator protein